MGSRLQSAAVRSLRAAGMLAALVFSATCGESGPISPNPEGSGRALFALKPVFAKLPAGAPSIVLSKIQAVLTGQNSVSLSAESRFVDGVATLQFDVPITGVQATFELVYSAFDLQGVLAYSGRQTITVRLGNNQSVPSPTLVYDAPDAKITSLRITGPATLAAGASGSLEIAGILPNGQSLTPRVSWTSSNPAVVAVNEAGGLTAGRSQGTATITATAANGLTSTFQVKVRAPVDKVTITPGTVRLPRGGTANATADLRDATNVVIDDRTPTWTSSDPSVATVSAAGVITALKIGRTTITAAVEGKEGSTDVTVISPIERIDISPGSVSFSSLKTTTTLSVRVVPVSGGSVTGLTPTLRSSNPAVATVDASGVVTAVANGTAQITAELDGITASAGVTVQQVATNVAVQPRSASVTALGASATFTANVIDAGSNPLTQPVVAWTSSDPTIATVAGTSATAVVTAVRAGTVTITATANGKTDAVTFVVAPQGNLLILLTSAGQIQAGQTATITPKLADLNGNPIRDIAATLTTSTPNTISINGNVVTGLSPGVGRVNGVSGSLTASINITVVPRPGGGGEGVTLVVSPERAEKLPNGTQQFTVAGGGEEFSWTVNGIPGGDATFGRITSAGFYTAPSAVPTPATFQVCAIQANPPGQGCAQVTISPIPSGGADVIVINDMNLWDNGNGFNQGGANQATFVRNLIGFTGPGARVSQTGFMFYRGHGSLCASSECSVASNSTMANTLTAAGYTVVNNSTATITGPIPSGIKVILLLTPSVAFSDQEINYLKAFAAEGGRIIFSGEHGGYYGSYVGPVENAFFAKMGAQLTNTAAVVQCTGQWVTTRIQPHQVTTGMTGVAVPCASGINLGPNDYALFFDTPGTTVIGAVAKIDLTPLPLSGGGQFNRRSVAPLAPSAVLDPPRVDGLNRPTPP